MSEKTAILWIRQDLRLEDNPALLAALDECQAVIPMFIWDPESEGTWTPGAASCWRLHGSLEKFDQTLRKKGSRLIIRRGDSLDTLRHCLQATGANQVYWNRLYEPATAARDEKIQSQLQSEGIPAQSFNASLLYEPWEIVKNDGKPYQVFTAYWNAGLALLEPPPPFSAPPRIPTPPSWPESLPLEQLNLLPKIDWAAGLRKTWLPGSSAGKETLTRFLADNLVNYQVDRDYPDRTGTSRLSPYLHFGEISPRTVWRAVREKMLNSSEKSVIENGWAFLRQLVWREFAHHLLHHFPHTTDQPLKPKFHDFPWHSAAEPLRVWQRGQTGYPIIDAGMRELWTTGWMHNRVRMITASFLVKNLLIPWQEGARWFWDTLVDADLANNTMGWQWVAGCGADAAPFFRIFNPVRQSEKFDPAGNYIRAWIPELARIPTTFIHQPWIAPTDILKQNGVELGNNYPYPIVDLAETRETALAAYRNIRQKTEKSE